MATAKFDRRFRRHQIAETIVALVARRGLAALSMAAVSRAMGVVPSALYRHFHSKDEMIDAALEHLAAQLVQAVRGDQRTRLHPLKHLRGLVLGFADHIDEFLVIPRLLFSEEVAFGPQDRRRRLQRHFKAYLAEVGKMLDQARAQGTVRTRVPTAALSVMFLGLFQSAGLAWRMQGGAFDVPLYMRRAWRAYEAMLQNTENKVNKRSHKE